MKLHLPDFRSYMIRTNGECIAFMPAEEEFSIQQLRDAVAGTPEPVCFTADGYALFRDKDGESKQLSVNPVATSLWHEAAPGESENILGRVFVAHPGHIPAYWKDVYHNLNRIRRPRKLVNVQTREQVA